MTEVLNRVASQQIADHLEQLNQDQTDFIASQIGGLLSYQDLRSPNSILDSEIANVIKGRNTQSHNSTLYPTVFSRVVFNAWLDFALAEDYRVKALRPKLQQITDLIFSSGSFQFDPKTAKKHQFKAHRTDYVDACPEAEGYFSDTCNQLLQNRFISQPIINVVHDPNQQPIGVQKSHKARTLLTLEPLLVDDIYLPPGSICKLKKSNNALPSGSSGANGFLVQTFLADNNFSLRPARLSPLAFLDSKDQAVYALQHNQQTYYLDQQRLETIRSINMAKFRQAAQVAIAACLD